MSERRRTDAEVLDKIASTHLGEMDWDNPSDALESISDLVRDTGRTIEGWASDE